MSRHHYDSLRCKSAWCIIRFATSLQLHFFAVVDFFASTESSFVASFAVADVIANLSMVTINSNSGQAITTFSADTCKMTLYDIYLSERGKEI